MSVGRSRLRPAPEGHPAPRSPASNGGRFTPPEAGLSRLAAHRHCSAEPFYELAQMSVCTKRLTLSVGRKGHLPPLPAPPGSVREGRGCQAGSRPRGFRHRPKARAPVNHQRRPRDNSSRRGCSVTSRLSASETQQTGGRGRRGRGARGRPRARTEPGPRPSAGRRHRTTLRSRGPRGRKGRGQRHFCARLGKAGPRAARRRRASWAGPG